MKTICLLHFAIILFAQNVLAGAVHIYGAVGNAGEESLQCTIAPNQVHTDLVRVVLPVTNGRFHHRFEVSATTFLSFSDGTNFFGGFVEPGDSIFVGYDRLDFGKSISYSGRGKEKFEIAYAINQIKSFPRKNFPAAQMRSFPVDFMFSALDSLINTVNTRINQFAGLMSRDSYMQLRGHLSATELLAKYNSLVAIFGDSYNAILANHREKLSETSVNQMEKLLKFDDAYYNSRLYLDAVKAITSIYLEENIQPGASNFADRKYQILADMLPEKLRSPVIYLTLRSDIANSTSDVTGPIFMDAAGKLADIELRQSIVAIIAETKVIKEGDKAPEFSVQNLSGETVTLSSFRGKTVYLDFWFASCGPCHLLFKSIEPVKTQFEHDDRVVFLTVSVDNHVAWKKAISSYGVKGYHVFTENKLREHPMIKSYGVEAYPTTYIIDPAGRFYSVRPSQNPGILRKQIEESLDVSRK